MASKIITARTSTVPWAAMITLGGRRGDGRGGRGVMGRGRGTSGGMQDLFDDLGGTLRHRLVLNSAAGGALGGHGRVKQRAVIRLHTRPADSSEQSGGASGVFHVTDIDTAVDAVNWEGYLGHENSPENGLGATLSTGGASAAAVWAAWVAPLTAALMASMLHSTDREASSLA